MKFESVSQSKARSQRKSLTFGELVMDVYETCGKRKAKGILHLALALRLVEFHGAKRFVIV